MKEDRLNIPTARNIVSRYKQKLLSSLRERGIFGDNEFVPPGKVEEILCGAIGISLSDLRSITLQASQFHIKRADVSKAAARALLDAAKQYLTASEMIGLYVQRPSYQEVDTALHATMGGCIDESDKIRDEVDRIWETYREFWKEEEQ